jgi:hypothetical protein
MPVRPGKKTSMMEIGEAEIGGLGSEYVPLCAAMMEGVAYGH